MTKKEDKRLPLNWKAMEALYVINGLTPLQLSKIYQAKANYISNQATIHGWVEKRRQEANRFATRQRMFKDRLGERVFSTMEKMIEKIAASVDADEMGPTVQDGEGLPNRFYLDTWKAVTGSMLKVDPENDDEPEEPAGFNVNGPDA